MCSGVSVAAFQNACNDQILVGSNRFSLTLRFESKHRRTSDEAMRVAHSCWRLETGENTATFKDQQGYTSAAYSPDGKTLAVGTREGGIKLWDMEKFNTGDK